MRLIVKTHLINSEDVALQIEIHPYLARPALVAACQSRGIVVQAFCPLLRGKKFDDAKLQAIATEMGKSPAQVLLRWSVQRGASALLRTPGPRPVRLCISYAPSLLCIF